MTKVVLVGGPSGVGKSTLIDSLDPDRFVRVKSFTTRAPKPGEPPGKYEHVTAAAFAQLDKQNQFVTVDHVYDAEYAMLKSAVDEIFAAGKIAIKEIHPSNHQKLRELLPEVKSVIILPTDFSQFWADLEGNAKGNPELIYRIEQDRQYYPGLASSLTHFDQVLHRDLHSPASKISKQFLSAF